METGNHRTHNITKMADVIDNNMAIIDKGIEILKIVWKTYDPENGIDKLGIEDRIRALKVMASVTESYIDLCHHFANNEMTVDEYDLCKIDYDVAEMLYYNIMTHSDSSD